MKLKYTVKVATYKRPVTSSAILRSCPFLESEMFKMISTNDGSSATLTFKHVLDKNRAFYDIVIDVELLDV